MVAIHVVFSIQLFSGPLTTHSIGEKSKNLPQSWPIDHSVFVIHLIAIIVLELDNRQKEGERERERARGKVSVRGRKAERQQDSKSRK